MRSLRFPARLLTRLAGTAAGVLLLAASAAAAELDDLQAGEVEQIATGYTFTEGPAAHPRGYLLFSDVPEKKIYRYNTKDGGKGQPKLWMEESGRTNGLAIAANGRIYGCQGGLQRVAMLQKRDGQAMAMGFDDTYDGAKLNMPNDLALDGDGGLYFTDPVYGKTEPTQPVLGVYYVNKRGQVSRVVDDIAKPNGILVSTDGQTLYVASADDVEIVAYDITGPGQIANKRTIYAGDKEIDGQHGPDGMAIDADGRLYATFNSVVVLNADGSLVGRIEIPEKPSNCIFGGDDNKTLFVTARKSLYRVPMTVSGQPLKKAGPTTAAVREQMKQMKQMKQDKAADGKAAKDKAAAVAVPPQTYPVFLQTATEDANAEAAPDAETVQAGPLTLTVPEGWSKQQPSNRLRLAQFAVPTDDGTALEAVVSGPFGGSDEQNIARWYGQFEADGREATTYTGTGDAGDYTLVDITGTYNQSVGPPIMRRTVAVPDARMLAVILPNPDGAGNYFLKLAGPAKTVDANAEKFRTVFGGDTSKESKAE